MDTAGGRRHVGAGSGLVRAGHYLYVVSDDEHQLAVFQLEAPGPGRLARFAPGKLPADATRRKRRKPDIEALVALPPSEDRPGGALVGLGSGSTRRRRGGFLWDLGADGALVGDPMRLDLRFLYEALERDIPDLNIEGAATTGERLLLFQRGNGRGAVNAVVEVDLRELFDQVGRGTVSAQVVGRIRRYDLGAVKGVRLCFTDAAALPDHRIVFTAVAEAVESTYLDGACVGAGVGLLDAHGELDAWEPLDPPLKIEGVEACLSGSGVDLLLVADADDRDSPSPLLAGRFGA